MLLHYKHASSHGYHHYISCSSMLPPLRVLKSCRCRLSSPQRRRLSSLRSRDMFLVVRQQPNISWSFHDHQYRAFDESQHPTQRISSCSHLSLSKFLSGIQEEVTHLDTRPASKGTLEIHKSARHLVSSSRLTVVRGRSSSAVCVARMSSAMARSHGSASGAATVSWSGSTSRSKRTLTTVTVTLALLGRSRRCSCGPSDGVA